MTAKKSAMQYTACCRRCHSVIPLVRSEIETGRNPQCEHCGEAMVVSSRTGGEHHPPLQEVKR
jgi:hypothetical protein